MQVIQGFYTVGDEEIYYEKILVPGVDCRTILLHGAGKSDSTRTFALREALYHRGIPTFAFDFSGHGKSTQHKPGSIKKRINEGYEIIKNLLDSTNDIHIMGFSMGGEVAVRLTEYFGVRSLFLFAPGIYDKSVIDIEFGEDFSKAIRRYESWKSHDLSRILEKYDGGLFLLTPEYDDVIPEGVNGEIMGVAPNAYKKRITIPGAPHMIGKWMNEHPERIDEILDQIQL